MEDAWLALRTLVDANPFLILRESQKDVFDGCQIYSIALKIDFVNVVSGNPNAVMNRIKFFIFSQVFRRASFTMLYPVFINILTI